ncbi:MAG: hypothetical protein ASUL_02884 [Candidatus Aramenus sulfurataquae]|nr:MAG: hypothetical protein ASUL_02884 [Candidatus Aramenus sulfurataquae]
MQFLMCQQSSGLGGKTQVIPVNYPINLQYVAQEVVMFLMGQGFQAFPMVAQNMAVIQAQHSSLLGTLTDSNRAYTIKICQGPGVVVVETGISNLLQDLLVAGGTVFLTDEVLHSKLLTAAGGGLDAYEIYKEYAQEEQLLNMITMLIVNSPPAYPQGYGPQPGQQAPYGQPYPQQGYYQPQPYPQPYSQPYPQQPYQQPPQIPPTQPQASQAQSQNVQPASQQTQRPQVKKVKCWKCGTENDEGAKFCYNCGASLQPIKCPSCGAINQPGAKFCYNCGAKLLEPQASKQ